MEPERSHEISILSDSVKKFMQKQILPAVEAVDHYPASPGPDGFFDSLLSHLGALGLLDLPSFPTPEGPGEEVNMLTAISETAAEIYASVPVILLAHGFARHLVVRTGRKEQQERWLPPAPDGSRPPLLGAPLYMEPDGCGLRLEGSVQADGSIHLTGTCEMVVNAPLADGLLLPVHVGKGMALVLLPADFQGLERSHPLLTLGLRACPVADVTLNNVRVPEHALLDAEHQAWAETCSLFAGPVAGLCAGICRGSLQEAVDYVAERRQGGHRLEEYSQVRMMIASMGMRMEAARAAAAGITRGGGLHVPETIARFVEAREAAVHATQDGVQLLGGYGYMEDYGQERRMRDARQVQALFGRDDRRRMELAEHFRCLIS